MTKTAIGKDNKMIKYNIVVYGVGNEYKKIKVYLEKNYNIVACCDKFVRENNVLSPFELQNLNYDKLYISSSKYYEEIRSELIDTYHVDAKKIISKVDVLGDYRNDELRDKWVINKLLEIPNDNIILDAGAGESKYKKYCTHLRYIAQDFGSYIPNQLKNGLQFDKWDYKEIDLKCDIVDIPLEDSAIDAILCTEVFEHLKNPMLALKEFSRLLRKGGELLLTAPFCSLTHMAPYYYYNGFSDFWYEEHLKDFGFEIMEVRNNGNYFRYMQQELNRVNEICQRYAHLDMPDEEQEKVYELIKMLDRYAVNDTGSDEILRFGTMIEAKKVI